MKTFTFIALFLSFSFISNLYGQYRYKDYQNDKFYFFEDNFDNNKEGWPIGKSDQYNMTIDNGFLFFEGKDEEWNTVLIPQYIDQFRDFEIETKMRYVRGLDTQANVIMWGAQDKKNAECFGFESSSFPKYCTGVIENGEDDLTWLRGKKLNQRAFNKLTIRKKRDNYYFFVNEKLVQAESFNTFLGQQVGFGVYSPVKIQIDYLKIAYIDGLGAHDPNETISFNAKKQTPKSPPIKSKTELEPVKANPIQVPMEKPEKRISDIDLTLDGNYDIENNLPTGKMKNADGIAVIIGNADYQKITPVAYARNDARTMEKYLTEVMGFQTHNIFYIEDATKSEMELVFGQKGNPKGKLYNAVKKDISDVFIFYSGHGAPSIKDKKGYFVPIDCDPNYIELTGYPLEVFYQNLNQIPAKHKTVIIDACFSGTNIFENISPVSIRVRDNHTLKEGAVITSSSSSQVSAWYNGKEHGLFTYFFLKAIHSKNGDLDKNGQLTLSEIHKYVAEENEGVPYYARRIHGVEQTPTITGMNSDWTLVWFVKPK